MIVKVQLPLNNPSGAALVYAQDRKRIAHVRLPEAVQSALGFDMKGYFEATEKNGQWVIGKRVAEQPW